MAPQQSPMQLKEWPDVSSHAQQSVKDPIPLLSQAAVHVLICDPLSQVLDTRRCLLGHVKVHKPADQNTLMNSAGPLH